MIILHTMEFKGLGIHTGLRSENSNGQCLLAIITSKIAPMRGALKKGIAKGSPCTAGLSHD